MSGCSTCSVYSGSYLYWYGQTHSDPGKRRTATKASLGGANSQAVNVLHCSLGAIAGFSIRPYSSMFSIGSVFVHSLPFLHPSFFRVDPGVGCTEPCLSCPFMAMTLKFYAGSGVRTIRQTHRLITWARHMSWFCILPSVVLS